MSVQLQWRGDVLLLGEFPLAYVEDDDAAGIRCVVHSAKPFEIEAVRWQDEADARQDIETWVRSELRKAVVDCG